MGGYPHGNIKRHQHLHSSDHILLEKRKFMYILAQAMDATLAGVMRACLPPTLPPVILSANVTPVFAYDLAGGATIYKLLFLIDIH